MSESNTIGDQQPAQRPWASPRQQPVKGIVQPRVLPPFGKPTRHTNKLDYIMTTVLKEASKHKHVWPFQKPVDAVSLCIPLYHEKVVRPMDLKTIENRLKSTYYTCAQECIDDIETVFNNCYIFNGKEDDVTIMAQNVHEVIKKALENAPREEHDMEVYWGKSKKKGKPGESKVDKKKDHRGPSEPPSECGSEKSSVVEKVEKRISGKKPGKRKAESDDEDKEKPEPQRVKRDVPVAKKDVTHSISPAMKPCLKMLNEFYTKKYYDIAWPFHEPVNADLLGLHDYHKIVKEPMDMRTIKKKLETGEYKEPSEFERDIKLMINNCLIYNPAGDPINQMGKKFLETFERKWADLGDSTSRASSVAPASVPPPTPVVSAPKVAKSAPVKEPQVVKEPKKEVKAEVANGSKSEDMVQLNNALSMIREREEKLRAELDTVTSLKEKLNLAKSRREENSAEPFPEKLITDARIACTTQSSSVPMAGISAYKNGKSKGSSSRKTPGYTFDSDDEENKKAMTYEDKRNLSMMINKLPPSHLSTIIAIIQRREDNAIAKQHQADSEIEIDFESLGEMCLREMEAFAKSVLNIKANDSDQKPPKLESSVDSKQSAPTDNKEEKKKRPEKSFNMSESSDDETSNSKKRRKKESSESESSSSSDDDSEDDVKNIPRKSGQPPSTSREWNQGQPQPRMGGMGGQPPTARVPPHVPIAKAVPNPPKPPVVAKSAKTSEKLPSVKSSEKMGKKSEVAGKSILDTLLPDSFGSSQVPGSSQASDDTATVSPTTKSHTTEDGENEEARIQRMRMEAKRAREREDENTVSMTNQMEMMSAFEFDNVY